MKITDNASRSVGHVGLFFAWHSAYSTDSAIEIINTSEIQYVQCKVSILYTQ